MCFFKAFTLALLALQLPLSQAWVHPGILHDTADLERMKSLVAAKTEPWYEAYTAFSQDYHSLLTYPFYGAPTKVTRDKVASKCVDFEQFAADSVAALQLALMWQITGSESYAQLSTKILESYASNLKTVDGSDGQLSAALSGSNLVNAAEIIRYTYSSSDYTSGWAAESVSAFENMVTDVLVPPASLTQSTAEVSLPFEANWGTSGENFMLAAAVFTENSTLYDSAKDLILNSPCAKLSGTISATGQSSESGRDQQHTQLGLGNLVEAFTTMEKQYDPDDFFAKLDNRLMAGLEYTAKYLMGGEVAYDETFVRCNANDLGGPWKSISTIGKTPRSVYEAGYAHYVGTKGLSMPYTKALIEANTPDGPNTATGVADGAAFQTLRFRLQVYTL